MQPEFCMICMCKTKQKHPTSYLQIQESSAYTNPSNFYTQSLYGEEDRPRECQHPTSQKYYAKYMQGRNNAWKLPAYSIKLQFHDKFWMLPDITMQLLNAP